MKDLELSDDVIKAAMLDVPETPDYLMLASCKDKENDL